MDYTVLAINPGSTSTKIGVFKNEEPLFVENIKFSAEAPITSEDYDEQVSYRKAMIEAWLQEKGIDVKSIDAYAGRGGGMIPCVAGTYEITERMLQDVRNDPLRHPAKYASCIAFNFAQENGKKAYTVSSPHTDEFEDVARLTGLVGVERKPHTHCLNQKEVANRAAKELGKKYNEMNFIVVHLGGGISVTAHKRGRMIDSTDAIMGDGPMTPTRSGQLDVISVVDLCYSGEFTKDQMYNRIMTNSGFLEHLGTSDGLEIENRVKAGEPYATLVYNTMLHQICKWIGAMAAVLDGDVDAILLTGGLVRDPMVVETITRKTKFIATIRTYPGEFEMEALSNGVLRVLTGQEDPLVYTGEPTWRGIQRP